MNTNEIMKSANVLIDVEVIIVKEDNYYVAYCPALELSSYGDSEDAAKKSFEEELEIFIDDTTKRGTLEKYLLQNGWKLQHFPEPIYEPPKTDSNILFRLAQSGSSLHHKKVSIPVY
jgi:predicted RNase H-like HicB family nuclease